jgi:acetamidase/formamidase
MSRHTLPLERRTVHGSFGTFLSPVLHIDDGDSVVFRTLDAGWGAFAKRRGIDVQGPALERGADDGHALCGPVFVRGAVPGDVLEVTIGEVRPATWGYTWAGPRPTMAYDLRVREHVEIGWRIDADAGTATDMDGLGITLGIHPFMGVMGNAPAEVGPLSTAPPRAVGGNLDCRHLVSGATLWLPVEVDGALFSTGDGHALQADGEASGTAIECPMERVELAFHVRKAMKLSFPAAQSGVGYLRFGLGYNLDSAAASALEQMVQHIEVQYGLSRSQAMAIASLVVDLHITQIANGVSGVHAVLPDGAISRG